MHGKYVYRQTIVAVVSFVYLKFDMFVYESILDGLDLSGND